jgi:hypothetical protein
LRAKFYVVAVTACAVTLAACGSSTSPSQQFQLIGGQYAATYVYHMSGAGFDSTATVQATINMLDADRGGTFTGSILFPGGDSGVIIGLFSSPTAFQFLQFGDAFEPPLYSRKVLTNLFRCNFADSAVFTETPGGGITGKQLTLAGTFNSYNCVTSSNTADSIPSTLTVSVTATNTTGPQ